MNPFRAIYTAPKTLFSRRLDVGFRFQTQKERNYFRLFQDEVALELASGFDSIVWNRIVLQACENPSIRQLTTATAALKQAGRASGCVRSPGAKPHLEYALQEYGRALKGLQRMYGPISSRQSTANLRLSLIAALLIFCFENMLGNIPQAFMHVKSVVELIPHNLMSDSKAIRNPFLMRGLIPSSIPEVLEDEILGQFVSLDRPGVGLICPSIQNKISLSRFHLQDRQMPSVFRTITEARNFYELLRYRMPALGVEHLSRKSSPILTGTHAAALMTKKVFTGAACHEYAPKLMDQLELWQQAFKLLLEYSRTVEGQAILLPAKILCVQVLSLDISLGGFSTDSPSRNSDFDFDHKKIPRSTFIVTRKIFDIVREVINHPRFSKSFVFDIGIVPPLWITAIVSPYREMQHEALGFLKEIIPRVECIWDSKAVSKAAEAYLNLIDQSGEMADPTEKTERTDYMGRSRSRTVAGKDHAVPKFAK